MSHLSRLEQELTRRFVLQSRVQAPSGLHRRFLGKFAGQPQSNPVIITCATYPALPDESVELQTRLAKRMQAPKSPTLTTVRDFQFDPEFHWMAAEMPSDRDLRDILRVQQRLNVEDVGWLMGALSEALQSAVEQGWPRLSLDASQVFLELEERRAKLHIPDMPLFGFSTLTITDTLHTMAFNPAAFANQEVQVPDSTRDYVTPLAALCCEALGAAAPSGGGQNERFRAIPVLTTHQNTLLRTALAGAQRHGFDHVDDFVAQFLSAGEAPGTHHTHPTHRPTATASTASTPPATAAPVAQSTITPPPPPTAPLSRWEALPMGYQLIRELRTAENWRLCKAKHHAQGEVLITTFDVSTELAESQRRLAGILQSLQQTANTTLIRPLEMLGDSRSLHVVRTQPPGRTLLDVLREHRSFSRPATARLLAAIHSAYEALWACVPGRPMATSLDQFWLPNEGGDSENKNLLLLDVSQLVVESFADLTAANSYPVNHFARLTLSLLGQDGGTLTGAGPSRFTPVPELSSEVNGVLRRALMPDPTGELTLPWLLSQVTAALAGHTAVAHASRQVMQVPEAMRDLPLKPAKRIRLQPKSADRPIIALIADDTFWLGRVGTHSDFVAQFRPRSPVNDNRTKCISRTQMRAYLHNGQVQLEEKSSTNPSHSGGRRLAETEVVQLPITIVLAGEYPIEIRALKSAYAPPGPAVVGWAAPSQRPLRRGACSFQALERGVLPFEAAWIFTDASLISDVNGQLIFDDYSPKNSAARFHHHADVFWVEATSVSRIILNGQPLKEGEVAPIGDGDELRLAEEVYIVTACAIEAAS